MRHKKYLFFLESSGLIMLSLGLMLLLGQPVDAQCGSQASSCKNCHEVQAQDPVNADGTGWHVSHAFGDFCYLCHAGNPQATDETAAHTGMVPPLSDVEAACQQCHAADLTERAQVYATTLNIDFGTGGGSGDTAEPIAPEAGAVEQPAVEQPVDSAPVEAQPVIDVPADNQLAVDDPNLVDYVQRYNEIVLGERPVNMGNIVLVALIGLLAFGGGGYVLIHEIRLSATASVLKQVDGSYPEDVVEMLPALARLKYETRKSLGKLLQNPKKTDKVIGLIDTLEESKIMKSIMAYIRRDEWSPYVAGILLGIVGVLAVWLSNSLLGASGAFETMAGMIGKALTPDLFNNMYFNYIMPPEMTNGLILVVGIFFGGMLGAATSGTLKWGKKDAANSDEQWKQIFGRQTWKRWAVAFVGAIILEYAAGIAGGCTSGLAISGGMLLAPAAFLFIAGMFASGIVTAMIVYRKRY